MKYKINVKVEKRFDANVNRTDDAGNPLAPLIQTVLRLAHLSH